MVILADKIQTAAGHVFTFIVHNLQKYLYLPRIRWLVAILSPLWIGVRTQIFRFGFMLIQVALRNVFL